MATTLTNPVVVSAIEGADPVMVTASVLVDPGNPLFAGHYPGFPIFPGVCLIECVHRSVLGAAEARGRWLALDQVRSTKFLAPAFPGDRLTAIVRITDRDGGWDCDGQVRRDDQDLAKVRLRYRQAAEVSQ
jgi:3-hydroxyacyl-[acyl-carrier-protein] dehydratase